MQIENVELFDLDGKIKEIDKMYAHTKENYKETLKEHLYKTYEYFLFLVKEKGLGKQIKFLAEKLKLSEESEKLFLKFFVNAVFLHDIGKINVNFQSVKMKNDIYIKNDVDKSDTNHSLLSAFIYLNIYTEEVEVIMSKKEKRILEGILFLNSYAISKHHSSFDIINEYGKKIGNFMKKEKYKDTCQHYEVKKFNPTISINDVCEKIPPEYVFIYIRFLFSCICTADFYATGSFMNSKAQNTLNTIKDEKIIEKYRNTELYKIIGKSVKVNDLTNVSDINILRTNLFKEAEENIKNNLNERIFYLEAPTGSGKTNMSINLATVLLENDKSLNRLFYIFPFNTLVEQTEKQLLDIFGENYIATLNSLTPYKENKKSDEEDFGKDYEQILLDRQFIHYPIVVTTHVNFFSYLFNIGKESIFTLANVANSIIIFDEIQSYKNSIWKYVINLLEKYAEFLNLKIIIMSATLPKLSNLTGEKVVTLIGNPKKYFEHPIFRERVKLDYSLLNFELKGNFDRNMEEEKLLLKIKEIAKKNDGNILVEFIRKKTAYEFFEKLNSLNFENRKIMLITSDDNKIERNRIINYLKNGNEDVILVATQVIEAGVDIDVKYGFKNISTLDSEEQFLGRINRNSRKKGAVVFFFYLDDPKRIYKEDHRLGDELSLTLLNEKNRENLLNKDFNSFYEAVFRKIVKKIEKNEKGNEEDINRNFRDLNFFEIEAVFKLIDEDKNVFKVFLNRNITDESGNIINGQEVWNDFFSILIDQEIGFAERKVKLSQIYSKLNNFIYEIRGTQIITYTDIIGDIYYIENGEDYFENGKLNIKKLTGEEVEFI
ncbi:CRISPR-associated helicase Cas3' [Leptotrichia sp. OH3620_COT-345]|uniref:CRISPR-associated helicase Cas3' n=1 Tax=Leptotrichia sp. OH3620_COT-345 TaxID=2491048 RepID=UPI000F64D104|nr:CRISPR-associated helicase Cas3' [Leptotrichia sp. OH3620_COT-345]RRD39071.1 CRISPR-associated helicase Cas3' [Leptotrichia sp. OH3620_COT-345]